MFDSRNIEILACPVDRARLTPDPAASADSPALRCVGCGARWPIVRGVPRFLHLDDDEVADRKVAEIKARDSSYDHRARNMARWVDDRFLEVDSVLRALGRIEGTRLLDAGCGDGIVSRHFHRASLLAGIDLSPRGLEVFQAPKVGQLLLTNGDVCSLPFADATFDKAISCQVLEHIPTHKQRLQFFSELQRVVKPGGKLVLTVYNWDKGRRAHHIPKEGTHQSGVFYHCYEPDELEADCGEAFHIDRISGIEFLLPGTFRAVHKMGRNRIGWDRFWQRQAWPMPYAKLLQVVGRARGKTTAVRATERVTEAVG